MLLQIPADDLRVEKKSGRSKPPLSATTPIRWPTNYGVATFFDSLFRCQGRIGTKST